MQRLMLIVMMLGIMWVNSVSQPGEVRKPIEKEVTFTIVYNSITMSEAGKIEKEVLEKHKNACSVDVEVNDVESYDGIALTTEDLSGFFFNNMYRNEQEPVYSELDVYDIILQDSLKVYKEFYLKYYRGSLVVGNDHWDLIDKGLCKFTYIDREGVLVTKIVSNEFIHNLRKERGFVHAP